MKTNKIDFTKKTLSEIAIEDYKYAEVFEKYGLDFCCNGNVNYLEACENKGIDKTILSMELKEASEIKENNEKYEDWKLDFLVDYIINNHHRYVNESIPKIIEHLNKLTAKHSDSHPEIKNINESFSIVSKDLQHHMFKEEKILFPYIKQMVLVYDGKAKNEVPYFGTVENPIRMMEDEHKNAGDLFKKIQELSNNYTAPADGCTTYKLTMNELKDFEEDLHKHIHLENNILFPKSVALEKELFVN
ncbi:MAG: iron-sulfur cluster repair di-iron protein [Bacteroidetes bacterium]|nr:iron-sulfur cluster repair di-iron protein [Bacteroidota bacterium]MCH8325314.1 iron-sulfur cluster repair di-iron protein [Bacteroidota bacterium]